MAVASYATHDAIFAYWQTKTLKLALLTAAPNPDGTGVVEPNGSHGYARQDVSLADLSRNAGISTTTNEDPIVFGTCTVADWAAVTYAALMGSDDTLLAYSPLPSSRVCGVGGSLSFGAATFQWRLK